jgi:hypothetical protein
MYQKIGMIMKLIEIVHKLSGKRLITICGANLSEGIPLIILAFAFKLK